MKIHVGAAFDLPEERPVGNDREKIELIKDFEELVDELVKEDPNENKIKQLMEKLNLDYKMSVSDRVGTVLEKMNKIVFAEKIKKDQYDLQ